VKYSFVLGYRNKDLKLTERCIQSLSNLKSHDYEIIIVDYGSAAEYQIPLQQLMHKYPKINYLYNETKGWPWNRAHALNCGIKIAKGECIITGDIDMIYPPDFIEKLNSYSEANIIYNYKCKYLPKGFVLQNNIYKIINNKKIKLSDSTAQGLMIANRNCYFSVNGFNEFYKVWGFEDMDLLRKLKKKGYAHQWIDELGLVVLHQWHPHVMKEHNNWVQPSSWFGIMKEYYDKQTENHSDWGKIYSEHTRPAYAAFKNKLSIKKIEIKHSLYFSLFEFLKYIEQMPVGDLAGINFKLHLPVIPKLGTIKNSFKFKRNAVKENISLSEVNAALFYIGISMHQSLFSDYYLEINKNSAELIIAK